MLHVKSFCFNPFAENTYVVSAADGTCAIIDPGCRSRAEQATLEAHILQNGLIPTIFLNTHCHLDHVFGNNFVHQTWNLPLRMHRAEQPVLDFSAKAGDLYQVPCEPYAGKIEYLESGDQCTLGGKSIQCLFTPGHSPGSLSFYCATSGWVISGDVLFQGSVGRTDLPGGDMDQLLKSIREQLYPLPESTIVYSGHGPATTIGAEKTSNPFVRTTKG
ncbi:MAG: MBL fold metallo-hydrolase [Bacteroidetes bacterium]|nr:MBL fold metallo-hydrolase [Bacteroidota bacterium]